MPCAEELACSLPAGRAVRWSRESKSRAFSEAAPTIGGGQRVGEQVRPAALAQQVDDFLSPAGVAAAGAAQGLAQRAGDDVHAAHHAVIFVRAAAVLAHEADGVRVVDHHQRVVLVGQVADARQVGDDAVHGEHAVGGDEAEPGVGRLLELRFQVGHVVVLVAEALGLAEPHAVDDAGVVQFVGDDRRLPRRGASRTGRRWRRSRKSRGSCPRCRGIR